MHYIDIEDDDGELVDLVNLCADSCARDYCQQTDETYRGWNGAHEAEFVTFCEMCGVVAGGLDMSSCQMSNVIVNRLLSADGERCIEHDGEHWIQLPASRLDPTQRTELVAGLVNAMQRVRALDVNGWDVTREPVGSAGLYRLTISEPMRGQQTTTAEPV